MANSKPVQSEEVIVKGVYDPTMRDGKLLRTELGKINAGFKNILKTSKEVFGKNQSPNTAKEIKAVTAAILESEKARKGILATQKIQLKNDQELEKLNQQKIKTEQLVTKGLIQERKETERLNKVKEREEKITAKNNKRRTEAIGSLNRMRATLIAARKRWDALSKSERENERIGGRLSKVITKLDSDVKRLEKSTGRSQRNVGNYGKAWSRVSSVMSSAGIRVLGLATVVFALTRAIGDAFGRIRAFDKELRNMAGIAGFTREELSEVEAQIREVASTSIKTSNEVAQLATTLFTLGKSRDEVIQLLAPVNNLSIALGATSDEAGELLVQTLNAFGRSSSSAQEFADVIANIRASTALDFQRIKEALGFLAPVAKAAGVSFEETGAILGVLVDNGIKAARAGRLVSTSFLKLAADGTNLTSALNRIKQAQDENRSSQDLLSLSAEIFGKESAAIGLILASNTERVSELTKEFENSEGALERLTSEQLKSLDAQLKIVDSAYEDFILSIEKGDGVLSRAIRKVLSLTTSFLNFLSALNQSEEDIARRAAANDLKEQIAKDVKELEEFAAKTKKIGETEGNARIRAAKVLAKSLEGIVEDSNERQVIQLNKRIEALKRFIGAEETLAKEARGRANKGANKEGVDTSDSEQKKADELIAISERLTELRIREIAKVQAENKKAIDDEIRAAKRKADELARIEIQKRKTAIEQNLMVTSAIDNELDRRNGLRSNDREREIEANRDALDRQRDLAAQGADSELAFRKEQGDKLALQKKEALEKEARELEAIQLTEAYFNALNAILSKPDANPNTAPAEALGTVLLAKGVAKALVPYYEGTEDTGSTGAMSDEHGAITGYTHSNERVIKATDNKQMDGLSNSELTQLAVDYKSGMLVSKHMFNDAGASLMVATRENTGPDPMVHRYDKMISLMEEANKRPIPSLNIDKLNRLVETIDRGGVKHKITYERRHIGK